MKVIKLDRRYAGFPKWNYMIQFPVRGRDKHKDYFRYQRAFKDLYGADTDHNPDREVGDWSKPYWIYNDHWHADFKRQRIVFKDQAVMSMIMLKITA